LLNHVSQSSFISVISLSIEWVIYEGRRVGGVGIKVCEHVQLCIDDSIIDKDVMPTIWEK